MKHESIFYTTLEVSGKGEQTQLDKSLSTIAAILNTNVGKITENDWPKAEGEDHIQKPVPKREGHVIMLMHTCSQTLSI